MNETIEWLFSKRENSDERYSLDRMVTACRALGNPEKGLRCIHVAGTNGKGSVCTKLAKAFELSGSIVGLFTSPHIASFQERICVQGVPISEEAIEAGVSTIRNVCSDALSFFEITTLLAFLWFREQGVQIAVIETGLGGRLDATNVCHPELCVITSISLDHTGRLGETIEKIAVEKAGIIKEHVPVIIGPRVPKEAIARAISRFHSPQIFQVDGTWEDFDDENSAIAEAAMKMECISPEIIAKAISVRPPCRFEEVPRSHILQRWKEAPKAIILDVAHNPDGIQRLLMKARATFPNSRFCFLLAVCRDKDVHEMISLLQKDAATIVCTESSSPRALLACELSAIVRQYGIEATEVADPKEALSLAVHISASAQLPLFVTGTFFLMSPVREVVNLS